MSFFALGIWILLLLVSVHFSISTGQLLSAAYLDVKLPKKETCSYTPYYDGVDSIFLFGCTTYPDLLKFSISSEAIQKVGSFPGAVLKGNVHSDNSGNLFYLGGVNHRQVHKYDVIENRTTILATLPASPDHGISFKPNTTSEVIFILGGHGMANELWSLDLKTLERTVLSTTLPFIVDSCAVFQVGNKAYIFGGTESYSNKMAMELDLDTLKMGQVGPSSLPEFNFPSVVWDGHSFAYIMGGYPSVSGAPTGGIFQFDPATYDNTFFPVRNFPVNESGHFTHAPSSVFVPSRNRIYFFGGGSYHPTTGSVNHDEIFYIDLTPLEPSPSTSTTTEAPGSTTLNPDFFSCNNRTNGLYPHPDCSLFIGCRNGEMTVFSCSHPLLFDPLSLVCTFPDEVECGTSCLEWPDGTYPHPNDCSLYILCRSGSSHPVKCPPPLLFNTDTLHCNFPEDVNCSA